SPRRRQSESRQASSRSQDQRREKSGNKRADGEEMNPKTAIEPQIDDHGRRYETANSKSAFHPLGEGSEAKCIVVHSRPSAVFLLLIQLRALVRLNLKAGFGSAAKRHKNLNMESL